MYLGVRVAPGPARWTQDRGRTRTFRRRERHCRGGTRYIVRMLSFQRRCQGRKRRRLRRWRRQSTCRGCRPSMCSCERRVPQRSLVCKRNPVLFEIRGGFRRRAGMGGRSRQKSQDLLRNTCQHDTPRTYTCRCPEREQGRRSTGKPRGRRCRGARSCWADTRGARRTRAGSSGPRGTARSFQRRAGSCRCQRGRPRSRWGGLAWG